MLVLHADLIPVPFTDQSSQEQRPVLVVLVLRTTGRTFRRKHAQTVKEIADTSFRLSQL